MGLSRDQMVKHVKAPNSIVCGLDMLYVPMKADIFHKCLFLLFLEIITSIYVFHTVDLLHIFFKNNLGNDFLSFFEYLLVNAFIRLLLDIICYQLLPESESLES